MASLPPFKSPGNSRRVLESSSLRDASLSQPQPLPQTPAARRKSTKERTPRQVTALLSARKSRPSVRKSAGGGLGALGGLLGGNGRGEDTPGGLIRALSRMPDLPPPTPEELEHDPTALSHPQHPSPSNGRNPLRDSILGQPLPGPLGESHPSSDNPSSSSSSAPSSSTRKPQPGTEKKAPRSSFFTTSLGRAYTPAFPLSLPPPGSGAGARAGAGFSALPEQEEEEEEDDPPSSGSDVAASLLSQQSHSQSQRSVASVERARRVSRVSSGFGGSPAAGRGRVSEFGESELGNEEEEEGGRRFSAVGSEKGGAGGRSSFASSLGGGAGRLSFAPSAGTGADDEEGEAEQFDFGTEEGGEFHWEEEMGGGEEGEEGEGERIPWERKGKGRALDYEMEAEVEGDGEVGGEMEEEGRMEDGWQQEQQEEYGSSAEEEEAGQVAASLTSQPHQQHLPPAPPLAKIAANRKKRAALEGGAGAKNKSKKKKKTQRYTPTGHPVPDLPLHRQKALFQHFLGPNVRVDERGMEEVMDASQEFFAQLMKDASAYARHAGRKHLVNEQDLVMLLTRQHVLHPSNRLQTHGRRLGLDRELQSVLDRIGGVESAVGGGGTKGKGKGRKRKAVEEGGRKEKARKRESEESEEEAEGSAVEED